MRTRIIPGLLILPVIGWAQNEPTTPDPRPPFAQTIAWSQQAIEAARTELATARSEIATVQPPLLHQLGNLQTDVLKLERESQLVTTQREASEQGVERLAAKIQTLAGQQQGIFQRLLYLRQKFDELLPAIERSGFQPALLAFEQVGHETTAQHLAQWQALFALADTAIDRLDAQIGGHRYPATALVAGVVTDGTALQFGPYAFFAPAQGPAGFVVDGTDLRARLRLLISSNDQAISAALAGRASTLPFDPLMDQAFLNADAKETLWAHLVSGGLWVIPILFFGFASLVIAIRKIVSIRSIQAPQSEQIAALAKATGQAAFDQLLDAFSPITRPIFAEGFAYRFAPEAARSAAMSQALLGFRRRLESGLSLLALTAAVAPLLGLLGTVTGMIKTFQVISLHGAGDARALSGGISEALVTTELGLVVAIPALLAHAWLQRRAKRLSIDTSSLAERYHQTLPATATKP